MKAHAADVHQAEEFLGTIASWHGIESEKDRGTVTSLNYDTDACGSPYRGGPA